MFMSSLNLSRRAALVLVAVSSLLGVACAGDSGRPTYAPMDSEVNAATAVAPQAAPACTTGETKSCTIFLGRHGDLANCVEGLDICSEGEWTGCIDEASLAENPELVSQLSAE
jgi:hypothetical protein